MVAPPRDDTYAEALKGLRNHAFLESEKWAEQQTRANRKGAHIDILDFERLLIKRLAKIGVPMFCHCLRRDMAAQNAAFETGVSKAKWGQSAHNFACAVDIIHSVKAWGITRREWAIIGHLGKEVAAAKGIKITWGGEFKGLYDPAHWEITGWRDLPHATGGIDNGP